MPRGEPTRSSSRSASSRLQHHLHLGRKTLEKTRPKGELPYAQGTMKGVMFAVQRIPSRGSSARSPCLGGAGLCAQHSCLVVRDTSEDRDSMCNLRRICETCCAHERRNAVSEVVSQELASVR